MDCLKCDYDLEDFRGFEHLGEVIECPNCKESFRVSHDIIWNGEEESIFFFVEYIDTKLKL